MMMNSYMQRDDDIDDECMYEKDDDLLGEREHY